MINPQPVNGFPIIGAIYMNIIDSQSSNGVFLQEKSVGMFSLFMQGNHLKWSV